MKRAMLKSLKPLGQRLDATRAAVERAAKRRVQAEEAKLLAEGVLTKAIDEEEQLKKELSALEASVGLDGVMHDAAAGSPIRTLGEALFTVVSQLRGMQAVDPSVAADAQTQCEHLFAKVCATVEAAEAAKCNAEAASATSRRLRGKQANASERAVPVTVTRRLAGKRKVHTPLTSFRGHPKMRRSLLNPGMRCELAQAKPSLQPDPWMLRARMALHHTAQEPRTRDRIRNEMPGCAALPRRGRCDARRTAVCARGDDMLRHSALPCHGR